MTEEKDMLLENVEFILSHFNGQEFMFPRSIMTFKTTGQVYVDSKDQMIKYFEEANLTDCRLNGYPYHYEQDIRKLYPSFIFIDLDLALCSTCKYPIRKLDYILKQTLLKLKEEINGRPTVLWTVGGYHIYQPIRIVTNDKVKQPLESFKELEEFIPFARTNLTTEFIRFAEKYFTNRKGDPNHNPSIHSCLIRIPGTINSKYNQEVKIIQKWDGIEAEANSLVLPFMDHLIQLKIENEELMKSKRNPASISNNKTIAWIDKLLETPIPDHRYYCLWHILIPYLKNIKGLSQNEIISVLNEWFEKCNRMNKVKWNYTQRIKDQLKYDKGYPPISLENLKKENYELYDLLQK